MVTDTQRGRQIVLLVQPVYRIVQTDMRCLCIVNYQTIDRRDSRVVCRPAIFARPRLLHCSIRGRADCVKHAQDVDMRRFIDLLAICAFVLCKVNICSLLNRRIKSPNTDSNGATSLISSRDDGVLLQYIRCNNGP